MKEAVNVLKKVGSFNIFVSLLIIFFLTFSILYETSVNVRTFIILLSAVSSSSLIFLVLRYREVYFPSPFSLFMFLFFGWIFISAFFSKDISQTIWEILRTASFLALFFAVYNLVRKKKYVQFFLLVSLAILCTLLVVKDMYYFFSWARPEEGRYFTGSFFWHNQMAGFLVILIPLMVSLFLATRQLYYKFFLFLSILILIIGIVLTQSRGGWLSLLVVLMLFALIYLRRMKSAIKPISILAVLFFIALLLLQPTGVIDKAKSIKEELFLETRSVSGNLRATVWKGAFNMISDNPVFGVGHGAFGEAFHKYQQAPWLYARNTHNHYLEYLAETGIVGFLLFILIILSAIFTVFRARNEITDEAKHPLLVGTVAALFGSGVHAFVDTDWARVSLYSIFWILMAVVLASLIKKEKILEVVGVKKTVYLFLFFPLGFALILGISNRSYEMARKNLEEGNVQEAETNILKAIQFNPYDFSSQLLYGQVKEIQKRPEGAKNIYHKATSLSFFNSEPLYRIGLIEFEKENYKSAKQWFEKAVKLNPYSHPKLYEGLSDSHLKLGDTKEARNTLKRAVEIAFPLNKSFRGFEYLYDYTGFKKELAKIYIKLISLDIMLGEKEEAKKLLAIVEKELDPENSLIPVFQEAVVK